MSFSFFQKRIVGIVGIERPRLPQSIVHCQPRKGAYFGFFAPTGSRRVVLFCGTDNTILQVHGPLSMSFFVVSSSPLLDQDKDNEEGSATSNTTTDRSDSHGDLLSADVWFMRTTEQVLSAASCCGTTNTTTISEVPPTTNNTTNSTQRLVPAAVIQKTVGGGGVLVEEDDDASTATSYSRRSVTSTTSSLSASTNQSNQSSHKNKSSRQGSLSGGPNNPQRRKSRRRLQQIAASWFSPSSANKKQVHTGQHRRGSTGSRKDPSVYRKSNSHLSSSSSVASSKSRAASSASSASSTTSNDKHNHKNNDMPPQPSTSSSSMDNDDDVRSVTSHKSSASAHSFRSLPTKTFRHKKPLRSLRKWAAAQSSNHNNNHNNNYHNNSAPQASRQQSQQQPPAPFQPASLLQPNSADSEDSPVNTSHDSSGLYPQLQQPQQAVPSTTKAVTLVQETTKTSHSSESISSTISSSQTSKEPASVTNKASSLSSTTPNVAPPPEPCFELMPMAKHDEYIDYSSSTSLERLSQTVESYFRQWHVDQGAQQHVSYYNHNHNNNKRTQEAGLDASNEPGSSALVPATPAIFASMRDPRTIPTRSTQRSLRTHQSHPPQEQQEEEHGSSSWTLPHVDPTPSLPRQQQTQQQPVRPLRQATFTWTLSYYVQSTRVSVPMELQLALWDDLSSSSPFPNVVPQPQQSPQSQHHVPGALHPRHDPSQPGPTAATQQWSPWSNLSALFGIGQHITLTPVVPNNAAWIHNPFAHFVTPTHHDTNWTDGTNVLHEFLHQSLLPSLYERQEQDSHTASAALAHVLSSWFQTALNLAAAETSCQIPTFGWWGHGYHPMTMTMTTTMTSLPTQASSSLVVVEPTEGGEQGPAAEEWSVTTGSSSLTGGTASGIMVPTEKEESLVVVPVALQLDVGFPPWLHHTWHRQAHVPPQPLESTSRPTSLFPDTSRNRPQRRRRRRSSLNNRSSIDAFGSNEKEGWCNLHHFAPLMAGTCYSDSKEKESPKRISFWMGTLPQTAAPSTAKTRLATWGDLLLRYCPPPKMDQATNASSSSPNSGSTTATGTAPVSPTRLDSYSSCLLQQPQGVVHLWYARHVYCWTKQPTSSASLTRTLDRSWESSGGSTLHSPPNSPRSSSMDGAHASSSASAAAWRSPLTTTLLAPPANLELTRQEQLQQQQQEALERDMRQLQSHLLDLVATAAGASQDDPLWGPVEDPIYSLWAFVTWKPTVPDNSLKTSFQTSPARNASSQVSGMEPPSPRPPPLHPASPMRTITTKTGNETKEEEEEQQHPVQPLLQLPLKIRSSQALSQEDWVEAEEAIESSVLNPLRALSFTLQVRHDASVVRTPLAAMQHCLLAALIRTSTLPGETLLSDLTDAAILEHWDTAAGNVIARELAQQAPGVGSTTMALVNAMDWAYAMEDLIEPWQTMDIVRQVLDTTVREQFLMLHHQHHNQFSLLQPSSSSKDDTQDKSSVHSLLKPLPKAAPFGRLFSILCVYISRVRSPSSMVQVFGTFVQELRRRWDFRELLPNMQTPLWGFDWDQEPTTSASSASAAPSTARYLGLGGGKYGPQSPVSSSLDQQMELPTDYHCLIGQKLQVFHLCLESIVVEETGLSPDGMEEPKGRRLDYEALPPVIEASPRSSNHNLPLPSEEAGDGNAGGPYESEVDDASVLTFYTKPFAIGQPFDDPMTEDEHNNTEDRFDTSLPPGAGAKKFKTFPHGSNHDAQSVASQQSRYWDSRSVASQATRRTRRTFADDPSVATFHTGQMTQYYDADQPSQTEANEPVPTWMTTRKGARCPVEGQSIRSNGHQVFAPYLQRPLPLTDDLMAQRRQWLGTSSSSGTKGHSNLGIAKLSPMSSQRDILERVEVANMMHRSKLLSDMSAFKAANPGCDLEDFIDWYGEPRSPLTDDQQAQEPLSSLSSSTMDAPNPEPCPSPPAASSLAVERTREFWSKTWKEAPSVAAEDQEPLFRASDTVEIALDYLETLHPANLISSVLATNLSNAYFSLVISAQVGADIGEDATQLASIHASLTRLREKVATALNLLSADTITQHGKAQMAHKQSSHLKSQSIPSSVSSYTSLETLSACETACRTIGENEVLLANALSLLHKFPSQYDLVERLLREYLQQQRTNGRRANSTKVTEIVSNLEIDDKDASLRQHVLEALATKAGTNSHGRLSTMHQQPSLLFPKRRQGGASAPPPPPVLREYLFRNTDEAHPCQLTVRCADEKKMDPDKTRRQRESVFGGLMVAITRTESIED